MTYESQTFTGRTRVSWLKKINPIWWFLNDAEPLPMDWHKPGAPQWWRVVSWYLRNPFNNAGDYVLGVVDRNYTAYGPAPLQATTIYEWDQWNGRPPRSKWKWHYLQMKWIRLPFVSYESDRIIFYAGWQVGGFFGLKFNLKTKFQLW